MYNRGVYTVSIGIHVAYILYHIDIVEMYIYMYL